MRMMREKRGSSREKNGGKTSSHRKGDKEKKEREREAKDPIL